MRNINNNSARKQLTDRRGAGAEHVELDTQAAQQIADPTSGAELIRVDEALRELGSVDPELAELLGVTKRTVRRRWDKARAWLMVTLSPDARGGQAYAAGWWTRPRGVRLPLWGWYCLAIAQGSPAVRRSVVSRPLTLRPRREERLFLWLSLHGKFSWVGCCKCRTVRHSYPVIRVVSEKTDRCAILPNG
jgi:hypothetical protein